MADRIYYVICQDNCKFEGMTKEQIIAAIAEATGNTPQSVDAAFITKIKEQNANAAVKIWVGTQAEYNAIEEKDPNTLYYYEDTDFTDLSSAIENIINGTTAVAEATHAVNADSAKRATKATIAEALTGQIDWVTTIQDNRVSHTLEPVEIFGDSYTAPETNEKAPLNGYDCTKGSIEERLTELGFKSGVITFGGVSYGSDNYTFRNGNGIYKQGKYVICQITDSNFNYKQAPSIIIPNGFTTEGSFYFVTYIKVGNLTQGNLWQKKAHEAQPTRLGAFGDTIQPGSSVYGTLYVNFGYEIN